MIFNYNERVLINRGFYKGFRGVIKGDRKSVV
jgi:hypothetical protein